MKRRCQWAEADPLLAAYHDREYGVPRCWSDRGCFELLSLEVFQAGLSWLTVLRKRAAFRCAFHRFAPERVAAMTASDVRRLLRDGCGSSRKPHHAPLRTGIIRNRLKIVATIANARQVLAIQREHGSFQRWLAALDDRDPQQTLRQFRRTFRFMGPEIVNEFLTCIGKRPVRHDAGCWMTTLGQR